MVKTYMLKNADPMAPFPFNSFAVALKALRDTPRQSSIRRGCVQAVIRALDVMLGEGDRTYEESDSSVATILERLAGSPQRALATAALVKTLPIYYEAHDGPLRPKLLTALEGQLKDVFPSDFFQAQGHEVVERVIKAQERVDSDFERALQQMTSLERAGACRQELMHCLNRNPNRSLLRPFLPNDLDALLGEFFSRLSTYLELRRDIGIIDAQKSFTEAATTLSASLHVAASEAAEAMLVRLVRPTEQFVLRDFEASPVVQPANLLLSPRERTYPLHLPNHKFVLPVYVTNQGPGIAQEVALHATVDSGAELPQAEILIGELPPGTQRVELEILVTSTSPLQALPALLELSWHTFDGSRREVSAELHLKAQRSDIQWAHVDKTTPYSLEAVQSAEELVGRHDLLERLVSTISAANIGSALIHGQKRVGKTSLAKALQSKAQSLGYCVLYVESGDYVDHRPETTIRQLGNRLVRLLSRAIPNPSIRTPTFDEGLAPLVDYFESITDHAPTLRLLIILDEFDELPSSLYERNQIGNSFFLTLRSITSRPNVGILLVGGEKIRHILEKQGDKLNKWSSIPVDYFRIDADWDDYCELVRRPVGSILEYSKSAIERLHVITAGNPYFTNLLCRQILHNAVAQEDCVVTDFEVDRAVEQLIRITEQNSFQHFWEDGILESGRAASDRSIVRRRTLIALSDCLARETPCSIKSVQAHPLMAKQDAAAALHEFYTRNVVAGDPDRGVYSLTVPLFWRWLRERGVRSLVGALGETDPAALRRRQREDERVKYEDLRSLVAAWPPYRGQTVGEAKVQAWLEQFDDAQDQRLMFQVLRALHFYSNTFVRKKMAEVRDIVERVAAGRAVAGKVFGPQLRITYFGGPARSGAHIAALFCDEHALPKEVVIERSMVPRELADNESCRMLVILDDFVGTGQTAVEGLRALHDEIGDLVRARDIKILHVVVAAHEKGSQAVRTVVDELQFGVHFHCCETLRVDDQAFSAKVFPDEGDRIRARDVARKYGGMLQRRHALGYGDLELAVVFERSCPNNSLPILWAQSRKPPWTALFRRS